MSNGLAFSVLKVQEYQIETEMHNRNMKINFFVSTCIIFYT